MDSIKRAMTVALCGLDGVGKTTLFDKMQSEVSKPGYIFIKKGQVDAERLVERRMPRIYHDYRDWLDGPFSEAIAAACAMDYCIYYDKVIQPAMKDSQSKVVVTDRHAICYLAYAMINKNPNQIAVNLLKTIEPPDVIIYVTLPENMIYERAAKHGTPLDEFEDKRSQREQAKAYARLLPGYGSLVIEVDNSNDVETTYRALIDHISTCSQAFEKTGFMEV